uniref:Uncharacterized protein n=1 Tax=Octopus bimaculoides TaxID=37653 RepID=A0A0L8GW65_OCTBM
MSAVVLKHFSITSSGLGPPAILLWLTVSCLRNSRLLFSEFVTCNTQVCLLHFLNLYDIYCWANIYASRQKDHKLSLYHFQYNIHDHHGIARPVCRSLSVIFQSN